MTTKAQAIQSLRNVLASLYSSDADAARVAGDAGLNTLHIDFGGSAINNWQNILSQAEKEESVEAVIGIAVAEFPRNKSLQEAVSAYQAAQEDEQEPADTGIDWARLQQMSTPQKMRLVNALLECPTVSDRQTRDTVVDGLPDAIKHNAQRSPNNRVDVVNLVTTALNYEGGLESLIEMVRAFEGDSIGMQGVDEVLQEIG